MTKTNVPQEKRKYPQEMLLMNGCPNCGQETNHLFVEHVIDEIVAQALQEERQRIVEMAKEKINIMQKHSKGNYCDGYVEAMTDIINLINKE